MSRVVRGGFPDRQFDVDFWQQQGDEAIFEAAWELVGLAEEFKGSNVELKPDFKDLLQLFNHHQVQPAAENAKRAYWALVEFGAQMADPTVDDLTQLHIVFQFGTAPARVDVLTTVVAHALACRGELEFAVRTVG
jgi:hypothetical protein